MLGAFGNVSRKTILTVLSPSRFDCLASRFSFLTRFVEVT